MPRAIDAEDDTELVGGNRGTYEGDIHNNVRHGAGTYVYGNQYFRYEGDYVNGKKHGQGQFFLGDGSVYAGDFINGEIEGHGRRSFPNGSSYTGEFKEGEFEGAGKFQGVEEEPDYQGQWRQNQRSGKGVLWLKNGDRYEGQFSQHRQHDNVIGFTAAGGRWCAGTWRLPAPRPG